MISFKEVKKTFNKDQIVLEKLNFQIKKGDFVTLLGSSGSGKTTTLKMINRLIEPDEGEITINGVNIQELDLVTLRRKIGYVVQQVGLFPHMTVAKNIATVPELVKWPQSEIKKRVKELMTFIQLPYSEYSNRYPVQLSGGQQQRVGVARALAANPEIVLFDEPFGAVDALTRKELQQELKNIHQMLGDKTFLFVTHDINEAFFLGNKVMIMNQGKISQFATTSEIIAHPNDTFVKNLLDTVYQEAEIWRGIQDA